MVHTDGGPQFLSYEFRKFAKPWEFAHSVSAPNHSRSDGKAEAAVKIAKRLLKRSQDTSHTRVAAVDLGTSPCQRLFGRRTRSVVPLNESDEVRALPSGKGLGEKSITYKNTNTAMERFYPRYKLANQFWLRMSS